MKLEKISARESASPSRAEDAIGAKKSVPVLQPLPHEAFPWRTPGERPGVAGCGFNNAVQLTLYHARAGPSRERERSRA